VVSVAVQTEEASAELLDTTALFNRRATLLPGGLVNGNSNGELGGLRRRPFFSMKRS
jgi:hypothetical protein